MIELQTDNNLPFIKYDRPFVYDYQAQILNSSARYTVTEAATKIGKTASHIIWLLEEAIKLRGDKSVWWVAPVFGQAEISFNRMRNQISDRDFFKVNETKLTLTLPTGVKIVFKSAERPDNLYGDDVYAAVFDEFTRSREEAWFALRSTLTATNGKCKFIGNVKGKKNWGYKLAQKAKAGELNHEYFKITALDAVAVGLLSMEEIDQARRDLPEIVFNELYLAEASDDGTNPFGYEYINRCIYPISTLPAVCFGIDLAKSVDYTVIIGLDKFGAVCHFERFQMDWKSTIQRILILPDGIPIEIDSTGVGDPIFEEVAGLRSDVQGYKFNQTSKQRLIEGLVLAIQKRDISFPDGIIVDELRNFEFEYTRTGVIYTAPPGFHDDAVISLALARLKYKSSANINGDVDYV